MNVTPFRFDTFEVRTLVDEHGAIWFVGKDVAAALGYADATKALRDHCDGEPNQRPILDALGRVQETRIINEPDLYRLVFNSKLESAKKFQKWVFEEVLPTLRKTGSYSSVPVLPAHTQDVVAAILLMGEFVAKVPGVKRGIATAATLACIKENTGLTSETLRLSLPAANEPICSLNATALGKHFGVSAKDTNKRLAALGLQVRNERDEWELTESGKKYGEALPYNRGGYSGYQILWSLETADLLS